MARYVPARCGVCGGTGNFIPAPPGYSTSISLPCMPCGGRGWLYVWETDGPWRLPDRGGHVPAVPPRDDSVGLTDTPDTPDTRT